MAEGSLVHTNLLIVWDILEDFATTLTTQHKKDEDHNLMVGCDNMMDEYANTMDNYNNMKGEVSGPGTQPDG
jgi:hypothetical protein